ncbi:unnamed protein product [Prunus armeniaca]|uniref:Uncharacterized protein n=1 Tax=Prunus armeniaca TaxID=36596 RepID=A0A6J5U9E9_PRUAR|nr:unnamed protein product [Prunus armeniaca]
MLLYFSPTGYCSSYCCNEFEYYETISDTANKFTILLIHMSCCKVHSEWMKVCNMMTTMTHHHRWSSGGSGCCNSYTPKAINKSVVLEAGILRNIMGQPGTG